MTLQARQTASFSDEASFLGTCGSFGKPAKLLPGCRHCCSYLSPSGKDPASFACFWVLLFGYCHSYFPYKSISFTRLIKWLLGCSLADAVDGFTQRSHHGLLLSKRQGERGGVRDPGPGLRCKRKRGRRKLPFTQVGEGYWRVCVWGEVVGNKAN